MISTQLTLAKRLNFYINAEYNDSYEVQLVRLIHGDTNPEGPGYKEAEIDASCNGTYQGKTREYMVDHISSCPNTII